MKNQKKNYMRIIIIFVLLLCLVLTLVGCNENSNEIVKQQTNTNKHIPVVLNNVIFYCYHEDGTDEKEINQIEQIGRVDDINEKLIKLYSDMSPQEVINIMGNNYIFGEKENENKYTWYIWYDENGNRVLVFFENGVINSVRFGSSMKKDIDLLNKDELINEIGLDFEDKNKLEFDYKDTIYTYKILDNGKKLVLNNSLNIEEMLLPKEIDVEFDEEILGNIKSMKNQYLLTTSGQLFEGRFEENVEVDFYNNPISMKYSFKRMNQDDWIIEHIGILLKEKLEVGPYYDFSEQQILFAQDIDNNIIDYFNYINYHKYFSYSEDEIEKLQNLVTEQKLVGTYKTISNNKDDLYLEYSDYFFSLLTEKNDFSEKYNLNIDAKMILFDDQLRSDKESWFYYAYYYFENDKVRIKVYSKDYGILEFEKLTDDQVNEKFKSMSWSTL